MKTHFCQDQETWVALSIRLDVTRSHISFVSKQRAIGGACGLSTVPLRRTSFLLLRQLHNVLDAIVNHQEQPNPWWAFVRTAVRSLFGSVPNVCSAPVRIPFGSVTPRCVSLHPVTFRLAAPSCANLCLVVPSCANFHPPDFFPLLICFDGWQTRFRVRSKRVLSTSFRECRTRFWFVWIGLQALFFG